MVMANAEDRPLKGRSSVRGGEAQLAQHGVGSVNLAQRLEDSGGVHGHSPGLLVGVKEVIGNLLEVSVEDDPHRSESTRLNSSHGYISYAVFCLKKKKT